MKLVNKYDTYKRKEGIYNVGESKTDKSQAEDSDIYNCIKKYGINSLIRQTQASEPLYLDNTTRNMTVADAVRMREQMDDYFDQLPAGIRKMFGDSTEVFYQKYKAGEFNDFLETGILTDEQIKYMTNEQIKEDNYYEEMARDNNSNTNTDTTSSKIDNTTVQDN